MTESEVYTYPQAFETQVFANEGGGITVFQLDPDGEEHMVVLTVHQARWLSAALTAIAEELSGIPPKPSDARE